VNGCAGDRIALRVANRAPQRSGILRLQGQRKQEENERSKAAAEKASRTELLRDCAEKVRTSTSNAETRHEYRSESNASETWSAHLDGHSISGTRKLLAKLTHTT